MQQHMQTSLISRRAGLGQVEGGTTMVTIKPPESKTSWSQVTLASVWVTLSTGSYSCLLKVLTFTVGVPPASSVPLFPVAILELFLKSCPSGHQAVHLLCIEAAVLEIASVCEISNVALWLPDPSGRRGSLGQLLVWNQLL